MLLVLGCDIQLAAYYLILHELFRWYKCVAILRLF